jgi:hypothetical protein
MYIMYPLLRIKFNNVNEKHISEVLSSLFSSRARNFVARFMSFFMTRLILISSIENLGADWI